MILENKEVTIYLSQQKLAEWGDIIIAAPIKQTREYQNKAERLRYYLKAIQYEFFLEDEEVIAILSCMERLAEITEWPTVPLITETEQPLILFGGTAIGDTGTPGQDGSDATIDVVSGDNEIVVVESEVLGVKTFTITYEPYELMLISMVITNSGFPNPGSYIQELGTTVNSVPIVVTLTKGSDDVDSSIFTGPGTLAADYAALIDLPNLNNGVNDPQVIPLTGDSITASSNYSVNADDLTNIAVAARSITFVVPFLSGSRLATDGLLTGANAYANLTQDIVVKGNRTIEFLGEDSYFEFWYPETYGLLNIIKDGNGFNATGAFIHSVESATMQNGSVSMHRYRTIVTDIPGEEYKFEF